MKNNGGLILIVEDHMAIAEMVGEFLEARGYEVDFARDGADALRLTAENTYDAILLDRSLPRVDGLDVCRRIRAEQRRSTPILMLTARDTLDDKVTGLEAGADDYLTKPFAIQELEARLASLTAREQEVFKLLILGMLNKQIAFELGNTERTVKAHRHSIMEKMQVKSVAELVVIATQLGLMQDAGVRSN